jgi:hypothetical protein
MASSKTWMDAEASASWGHLAMRGALTAVVGFATLSLKDGIESGDWGDWVAPLTDASCIAGAMFLLNALLKLLRRTTS